MDLNAVRQQALRLSLNNLRANDPQIVEILATAKHTQMYALENSAWNKIDVEGPLFLLRRNVQQQGDCKYRLVVLNRKTPQNFTQDLSFKQLRIHRQEQFAFLKRKDRVAMGLWFHDQKECASFVDEIRKVKQRDPSTLYGMKMLPDQQGESRPQAQQQGQQNQPRTPPQQQAAQNNNNKSNNQQATPNSKKSRRQRQEEKKQAKQEQQPPVTILKRGESPPIQNVSKKKKKQQQQQQQQQPQKSSITTTAKEKNLNRDAFKTKLVTTLLDDEMIDSLFAKYNTFAESGQEDSISAFLLR